MIATNLQLTLDAHRSHTPTRNACAIARRFALDLESPLPPARSLRLPLSSGRITLLEGPSGAGKSTILRAAIRQAQDSGTRVLDPSQRRLRNLPMIDLVRGETPEASARFLAMAGLADPAVFVRRANALSTGEIARLRIAIALNQLKDMQSPTLLVLDDFAHDLDIHSARTVGALLSRAIRATHTSALLATTRTGLSHPLVAAHHLTVDLTGAITAQEVATTDFWRPNVQIVRNASPRRWRDLRWAHHLGSDPASVTERIAAIDPETNETRAVMLLAMPTLNARWRKRAFPGRFNGPDKRDNARAVNRDLRRIARVVVDPRFRGLGLATALVREYLNAPQTPCTEAVAAMGAFSGFFERAGMYGAPLPPSPADARLLDALAHARIESWRLTTPSGAFFRAQDRMGDEFLRRELTIWAVGARARARRDDIEATFRIACRTLTSGLTVFTHTSAETEAFQ